MNAVLVCALLTTALYYLGSRAVVTQWLWSRYPPKLAQFMDCSACSGFWYGLSIGLVLQLDLGVLRPSAVYLLFPLDAYYTPAVIGLCSIVLTPIMGGLMQAGFERLGSAVEGPDG